MTPQQFAAAMSRKRMALKTAVLDAERKTLTETKTLFVQRSSGPLSSKRLREMGHPYSTRKSGAVMRAVGNIDPSLINAQTGTFRRRWKRTSPRQSAGAIRSSVTNTDPKARFMCGTGRMVARRIDTYVAMRMKPRRRIIHRYALQRALRA